MVNNEDKTVWIDGVPYIRDDSTIPPRITLHPAYKPTIRFRIKQWYWGVQCKKDSFKKCLHNKIYNLWRRYR